jgi:hypothetical protein
VTRTGNLLYLSGKGIAQKKPVAIISTVGLILHMHFSDNSEIIFKAEVGIDTALSSTSCSFTYGLLASI